MPIHCTDIDTLVYTYIDNELADEDRSALEEHLAACSSCAGQASEEIAFNEKMRARLTPPRAPEGMRQRTLEALDREDWSSARQRRARRVRTWVLPAAATVAAAAAMLLFVVERQTPAAEVSVVDDAVRQHMRRAPIEVQGAAVTPFIQRHFSPQAQLPRFADANIRNKGARLSHLRERDALQLFYEVTGPAERYDVGVFVVRARGLTFRSEQSVLVGGRELWITQRLGYSAVSFADDDGLAYVFTSAAPSATLLDIVVTSDLMMRVSESIRPNER